MTIYRHISSFADLLMLKTPRAIHQFLYGKPFAWYTYEKFAFLCAFCSPLSFFEMISLHQFYTRSFVCFLFITFLRFYCLRSSADILFSFFRNHVSRPIFNLCKIPPPYNSVLNLNLRCLTKFTTSNEFIIDN